jgi:TonB family protein
MTRRSASALVAVPTLLLGIAAATAASPTLDELLAREATPGNLLLLVPHRNDPRVLERWAQALGTPDPATRAVAARALLAAGPRALVERLRRAYLGETDAQAAREELRALRVLDDRDALTAWLTAEQADAARKDAAALVFAPPAPTEADAGADAAAGGKPAAPPEAVVVRQAADWPRGLVADVLAQTGCKPGDQPMATAEARFAPTGRLKALDIAAVPAAPGCADAVRALLTAAVAASDTRPGEPELLVLFLDPERTACADAWAALPDEERSSAPHDPSDEDSTPAEVLKSALPSYPDALRKAGVEGNVVVSGFVTPHGCITDLVRLDGPPALAVAALDGLSGWRFRAARRGDREVPTRLTVPVHFTGKGKKGRWGKRPIVEPLPDAGWERPVDGE